MDSPVVYFYNNLIFNKDKSCWALYEVDGFNYDLSSNELKINILHRLTRFIGAINSEAKILVIPVKQDTKKHYEKLRERINKDSELYDKALFISNETEKYLINNQSNNNNINDYKTYVCIKLALTNEISLVNELKDAFDYFIKNPINAISVFMNVAKSDILKSKVDYYERLAEKVEREQRNRLKIRATSTATTQWTLRRMMYRGLDKDVQLFYKSVAEDWKPYAVDMPLNEENIIKPYVQDVVNLFSGAIRMKDRLLEIEHEKDNISYQTFLSITNIPEQMIFPGCEWLHMLQKQNMQAEICLHVKTWEHRKAIGQITKKKQEINSQIEETLKANADISDDLMDSKEDSDYLESELKKEKLPISQTAITICLSSNDRQDLENKVSIIKNHFEDLNFIIERPIADQLKLFYQFIPSVSTPVKDFVMNLSPRAVASGIIGATTMLGDNVGGYMGTTGISKKHVYLDLGLAPLLNKSASAFVAGNLGYGKSFNTNLMVYQNFIYGGYNLIFDPKGERTHWKDFHLFKDHINVINITSDNKFIGTLDPFNVHDDIEEAKGLAISVICELFYVKQNEDTYTAILEAMRVLTVKVNEEKLKPSMTLFCEILDNFPTSDELFGVAKSLSRKLSLIKEAGMAKLIFGTGEEKTLNISYRLNILQIQNLSLPSPTTPKDDYTADETISSVLMLVMGNFCKKFALIPRNVFSLILFDESWILGKTTEGLKLFDFLARMGRSLFTGCIFNGHSVLDIASEGIKNTITYKFCFHTDETAEAKRMLDFVGLEQTEYNIELIKNLGNGECLFQDLYKRVGILKFDFVFSDIKDLFSTTPKTEEDIKKEEKQGNNQERIVVADKSVKAFEVVDLKARAVKIKTTVEDEEKTAIDNTSLDENIVYTIDNLIDFDIEELLKKEETIKEVVKE